MSSFGQQLFDGYLQRNSTVKIPEHIMDAMHDFLVYVAGPMLEEFISEPAKPYAYARSMIRYMEEMCSDEGLIDVCNEETGHDFDADEMRASSELLHNTLLQGMEILTSRCDASDVTDELDLLGMSIGELMANCRKILIVSKSVVDLARLEQGSNITLREIWLNYDPPITLT